MFSCYHTLQYVVCTKEAFYIHLTCIYSCTYSLQNIRCTNAYKLRANDFCPFLTHNEWISTIKVNLKYTYPETQNILCRGCDRTRPVMAWYESIVPM